MHIKTLKLQNFRNYEDARFVLDPAVNLICGENGQGKTNLLEAAAACSTMRLFRTAQKKEGLRFGEDAAFICSEFEAQGRENTLELRLSRLRAMEIYKNGVRQKRQSDVQGLLKTVLFCPEDLMLVRAGAAARRRFLDTALCQLRPNYARYLEEYNRLHEHKTRILRDSEEKPSLLSMWEDFSLRMARIGAQIIRYRAYYCQQRQRSVRVRAAARARADRPCIPAQKRRDRGEKLPFRTAQGRSRAAARRAERVGVRFAGTGAHLHAVAQAGRARAIF